MNPGISPSLLTLVMVDVLHEAGLIDDEGQAKAHAYLAKIPRHLKATVEDYEKWRFDIRGVKVDDGN